MKRLTVICLCLMLCLAGTTIQIDAKVSTADTVANRVIIITIGSKILKVDDVDGEIDAGPQIKWGRTMLPVRFIAEQFGALVTWNSTLQRVTLTLKVAGPPLPPLTQRIVSFTPSQTSSVFLTLLADKSVDVIEMAAGTYHLSYTIINIDRTRPIVVRPAAGATVVLSGANIGTDPQFGFGFGGTAGNITMQGLIFDGFILGQQGIIQACDCHDITLNDMVVRNSRANGTTATPYQSWAIYITSTSTIIPTNITANCWTVDGSARGMSALQVYGGSHIIATGWSVSNSYYAIYASSSRGPLTDFVLDDWTISNTGAPAWGTSNVSLAIENASGKVSNMHTTVSGGLLNVGTPKLTDSGGNSL